MSTHLSRHFRQRRLDLGLRLPDVARRCGYQNIAKGCNRIDRFEKSGEIHPQLYIKLAAALEIDPATCDRLNELDKQQARKEWLEFINEPIEPHIVFRAIPGVFFGKDLPDNCATVEEMEAFASEFARKYHKMVWLILSRKLTIRYNDDGTKRSVDEATPDHPNAPYMRLKRGRTPFLFGCDGGGLSLRPIQRPPKLAAESDDDK